MVSKAAGCVAGVAAVCYVLGVPERITVIMAAMAAGLAVAWLINKFMKNRA